MNNIYKLVALVVALVLMVVALTLGSVDLLVTPYSSDNSELCRPWDDTFTDETANEIRDRYTVDIKEYRRSETGELMGYGFYYNGKFTITSENLTVRNFYWTTTSVILHRETCHIGYILTDDEGKTVVID